MRTFITFSIALLTITIQAQDVAFEWVRQFAGESECDGLAIAIDDDANVYTTGFFEGTIDFDPGAGIFDLVSQGSHDAYVSKLDADGNLIWVKQFIGTSSIRGYSIAVDSSGNVYTSGLAQFEVDMDPGLETFYLNLGINPGTYISKLDSEGNFVWAKVFNGSNYVTGLSIVLDDSVNVYVGGSFKESAFFGYDNGEQVILTSAGFYDAFIVKLDSSGNYLWANRFGGNGNDFVQSIALDSEANLYTTGSFSGGVDFDPSEEEFLLSGDAFVHKQDLAGNFVWAKAIDGTEAVGLALAIDDMANVNYAGIFSGTVDFDPGDDIYEMFSTGGTNIFISKLDANGDFLWAGQMGGSGYDFVNAMALDDLGNVYTTGFFRNTADFDPGADEYPLGASDVSDVFVSKLDTNGNFNWAKKLGGPGHEEGHAIAVDNVGNVYSTGVFVENTDFDPGAEVFTITSLGSGDAFVHKMDALGTGVGINKNTVIGEIHLYPNPNHGDFNVVGEDLKNLVIYSVAGRIIQSFDMKGSNNYLVKMVDAARGLYLVKITSEKGEKVFQVVVR